MVGPQPDLEHAPDGIARREHAAEPGGDQKVTDDDVGVVREVRQAQAAAVAGADGDRAQAVAVHADGHGVVGIGDQHGLRRQRPDAHDLPHDALRVDQRLADEHVVDEPAVQVEPLPIRVEVDGEDLGDERAAADARRRIEQLAQACVLALEHLEPLEPRFRLEALAAKQPVLGDQRVALRERIAQRVPHAERQIDGDAHGIHDDGQRLANAHEMLLAAVEQHQRDADDGEQQEARAHGEPASP